MLLTDRKKEAEFYKKELKTIEDKEISAFVDKAAKLINSTNNNDNTPLINSITKEVVTRLQRKSYDEFKNETSTNIAVEMAKRLKQKQDRNAAILAAQQQIIKNPPQAIGDHIAKKTKSIEDENKQLQNKMNSMEKQLSEIKELVA
jgi:hypothetical protein